MITALVTTAVGLAWYVYTLPQVPDLAAQAARASLARGAGVTEWWVGWFGGLQMPSYSVLAPITMALVSTAVVGIGAALVSAVAMADLLRGSVRPRAGAASFGLMAVANVVAGRLTFALAFACALVTLAALRRHRWTASIIFAGVCGVTSLLAGLFLGAAAAVVMVADPSRRRPACIIAAVLLGEAVAEQILFPQTGSMPYSVGDLFAASAIAGGVAVLVSHRILRVGALLMVALPLAMLIDPGAVGENVVRLSWMVGAPLIVAFAETDRRWLVTAATLCAAVWPISTTMAAVVAAGDPAAKRVYYLPLKAALTRQSTAAGAAAVGERIEVVPTRTHWETSYLVDRFQLARGWDRQADVGDNPLFYSGALDSATYRSWLTEMAVGWVARPNTPLDGAGVAEAALIDEGQPYLHLVWANADWRLYRVLAAEPLARGARVVRVTPTSVTVHFSQPGHADVQLRWSPFLVATAAAPTSGAACATERGLFTRVTVATEGDYTIHAAFLRADSRCSLDPEANG